MSVVKLGHRSRKACRRPDAADSVLSSPRLRQLLRHRTRVSLTEIPTSFREASMMQFARPFVVRNAMGRKLSYSLLFSCSCTSLPRRSPRHLQRRLVAKLLMAIESGSPRVRADRPSHAQCPNHNSHS